MMAEVEFLFCKYVDIDVIKGVGNITGYTIDIYVIPQQELVNQNRKKRLKILKKDCVKYPKDWKSWGSTIHPGQTIHRLI
jgi:hypothetical protein